MLLSVREDVNRKQVQVRRYARKEAMEAASKICAFPTLADGASSNPAAFESPRQIITNEFAGYARAVVAMYRCTYF